jgi:hypothetical protein
MPPFPQITAAINHRPPSAAGRRRHHSPKTPPAAGHRPCSNVGPRRLPQADISCRSLPAVSHPHRCRRRPSQRATRHEATAAPPTRAIRLPCWCEHATAALHVATAALPMWPRRRPAPQQAHAPSSHPLPLIVACLLPVITQTYPARWQGLASTVDAVAMATILESTSDCPTGSGFGTASIWLSIG